ncbi:MAG TPA: hypothetical protein VFJ97_02925, partial [Dermatophilaceae bacterium]|nr:hypothetical protein [Dermatophilaceae bacterium]
MTRLACPRDLQVPDGGYVGCPNLAGKCDANDPNGGVGPLSILYRQVLSPATFRPVGPWVAIGATCFPETDFTGARTLGLDSIRRAWSLTPWAVPAVHLQPEGNITLVTLPAYVEVRWPAKGFQPGETNTVTLLGYRVRIRPTLEHYLYHFGDGQTAGPTRDPGGPWPDGHVIHPYPQPGTYPTRVDVTYGGQFSLDNGPWTTIPDTTTVTGATTTLTVKTAKN